MSIEKTADISFQHDPLPHSLTHIRLLEVLPQVSETDNLVRCRLRNVRLNEQDLSYTAISYAWQHAGQDRIIQLNGQFFTVKENVYHFLRRHRQRLLLREVAAVFVWIDAICLDFSSTSERNDQTTLMPNIFAKAKDVLICLEPRVPAPTISAYSLNQLELFFKQIQQDLNLERTPSNDRLIAKRYLRQDLNTCAEKHTNEWATLLQICQHAYWSRLWILLETRFAQNLQIMYSSSIWPWGVFRTPFVLANCLENSHDLDASPIARILQTPIVDVLAIRIDSQSMTASATSQASLYSRYIDEKSQISKNKPLPVLITNHRRRICEERLDRVYALIGIADTNLSVDYSRTNIELFCAVLLSVRGSPELNFVSMMAEQLGVSAFEYKQNRRSMLYGVPSHKADQSAQDMIGHTCQNVFSVRLIQARTEISDILQLRLGPHKLKYYQMTSQQNLRNMQDWDDMPAMAKDLPRFHGHVPGSNMPIVDGFDLSQTAFRPSIFLNPSQRSFKRKAVFGMVSTSDIQPGDLLVTEEKMYTGLIIRISGLRKTWLTVVGVVLFVRRVTVESECTLSGMPNSPTATIRSTSLSDFCEHTLPTSFTITNAENHEQFTLKPHEMQLPSLFAATSLSSGRHSRTSSNMTNSTTSSPSKASSRRMISKSDRVDRLMDAINPMKRRMTK